MKFKIETNMEAFLRELSGNSESALNAASQELINTAYDVEAAAKENIKINETVDTGRLLGSIKTKHKKSNGLVEASVGTNVEYANYIEYGTKKMGAKPFLNPAFDSKTEGLDQRIRQAIRSSIR